MLMSKDFRDLYRSPETAYASMDFKGKGFISQEDLLESMVVKKHISSGKFTQDDIMYFLQYFNLFPLKGGNRQTHTESGNTPTRGVMIFDTFKKTFFSHLHQTFNIAEIMQDTQDEEKISNRIQKEPEYVKERLKKLENFLKDKFQKCWVSVRKAFLDLDTDHDGFISVEDIIRYFGTENEFSFQDLKKLIQDKDSKKKGFLSYQDFSRWVGNSIHSVQGFYFRHDSVKNPQFEKNLNKYVDKIGKFQEMISKGMVNQDDVIKLVLEKIQFQWKTIRKSFHGFSKDKSGGIEPEELKFYFNHWGIYVSDETFNKVYEALDWDKDGRISYADFQKTVGCEIHPGESLYFRQDQPSMLKINTCKHLKCWQPTKQGKYFCQLHIKVNRDYANDLLMKIYKSLGKKWGPFINEVKRKAETQDHHEIMMDTFTNILKRYKLSLTDHEKDQLLDSYPGNDEGQRIILNISQLYQMRQHYAVSQTYKKVNVGDSDTDDIPIDVQGYLGDPIRKKEKLKPLSEEEILTTITSEVSKFVQVMRLIKYIDKDNNGYVTITELDDILKIQYPQFKSCDLHAFMKKYRSIQNKILVDYKKMRAQIIKIVKKDEDGKRASDISIISQTEKKENKRGSIREYRDDSLDNDKVIHNPKSVDRKQKGRTDSLEKELGEIIQIDLSKIFDNKNKKNEPMVKQDPQIQKATQDLLRTQQEQMQKEYQNTYEWDRITKSSNIPIKKVNQDSNNFSKNSTTIDQSERKSSPVIPKLQQQQNNSQVNPFNTSFNQVHLHDNSNSQSALKHKTAMNFFTTNSKVLQDQKEVKSVSRFLRKTLKTKIPNRKGEYSQETSLIQLQPIIQVQPDNFHSNQKQQNVTKNSKLLFQQLEVTRNLMNPMNKTITAFPKHYYNETGSISQLNQKSLFKKNSINSNNQRLSPLKSRLDAYKSANNSTISNIDIQNQDDSYTRTQSVLIKKSSRNNLNQRKSSMNDTNESIRLKLAERIKEFRRELKSTEGREHSTKDGRMDSQSLIQAQNNSVEKFRKTLHSFGLDVSNKLKNMRKNKKITEDQTVNKIAVEGLIIKEEDLMNELNFRRFKSQTRSMIESSNSPNKRAALSTQGEDSLQLSSSGLKKNCCCKDKKSCCCGPISKPVNSAQVKFAVNRTEKIQMKSAVRAKPTYYTAYHIEVQTIIGEWTLTYRFSEISKFHDYVKKSYSRKFRIPKFPTKKIWKNDEKVVQERKQQIPDYLNKLNSEIDILQDDHICNFLKIEGYMRDYLSDMQLNNNRSAKTSLDKLSRQKSPKRITSRMKKAETSLMQFDDSSGLDFDEDCVLLTNTSLVKNRSLVDLGFGKKLCNSTIDSKEDQVYSLYMLYKKHNLTEEEVLNKFFQAIQNQQENKDYFIRDLEDFYFQARPRFSSRQIRTLLEGDTFNKIQGLLFFMSEIDESFVSACSALQFISKLIDFQKNMNADSIMREMVKIDPRKMKNYNFEKYLQYQNFEGYKLQVLNILYQYVDHRKTYKSTYGTFGGKTSSPGATRTSSDPTMENVFESTKPEKNRQETEEDIVRQLIKDPIFQQDLLLHIRAKQAQAQNFTTMNQNTIKSPISSEKNTRKRSNFLLDKSISQRTETEGANSNGDKVGSGDLNSKESPTNPKKSKSDLIFLQDELRILSKSRDYNSQGFFEDLIKEFMNNPRDSSDIQSVQSAFDVQLLLHHYNNNEDINFRFDNIVSFKLSNSSSKPPTSKKGFTKQSSPLSLDTFLIHQDLMSRLGLSAKIIKSSDMQQRINMTTNSGEKVDLTFLLYHHLSGQQNAILYLIKDTEANQKFERYCVVCFKALSQNKEQSAANQYEVFVKVKSEFLLNEQTTTQPSQQAFNFDTDENIINETPTLNVDLTQSKSDQDLSAVIGLNEGEKDRYKQQVIEKLVEVLIDLQVISVDQDINPKFELIKID